MRERLTPPGPAVARAPLRRAGANRRAEASAPRDRQAAGEHGALDGVGEVLSSSGAALEPGLKGFMERGFGRDFSGVRVHRDAAATASARALDASAYTVGDALVFDAERYAPHTWDGRRLIAHELAHAVQQRGRAASASSIVPEHHASEGEAQRAAAGVMRGVRPAIAAQVPAAGLQREPRQKPKPEPMPPVVPEQTTRPAPQVVPPAQTPPAVPAVKDSQDTTTAPPPKPVPNAPPATPVPAGKPTPSTGEADRPKVELGIGPEFERGLLRPKTEVSQKFELKLTLPIGSDALKLGHLSFLKELELGASVRYSAEKKGDEPLERSFKPIVVGASLKAISLDWEKVKVPFGVLDFGVGISGKAESEPVSGDLKAGGEAKAEVQYRRSAKSPWFLSVEVDGALTRERDGRTLVDYTQASWGVGLQAGVTFDVGPSKGSR